MSDCPTESDEPIDIGESADDQPTSHQQHLRELEALRESDFRKPDLAQLNADLQFLKFALNSASIVAISDANSVITYVNDKFCQVSGYSREELVGQHHRLLNSGLHSSEYFCEMYRTITRGEVWRGDIRNRRKDGSYYWIEATIVPEMSLAGMPLRYVEICNDITERKKTEEELRVARHRLEAALDASQVVLFHQDRQLNYTWIHNPALGYSAADVIGKRDGDLFGNSHDAERTEAIKHWVIETQTPRREEVCITHNSELRYFDLVVQPDYTASSELAGVHCAAVDVTSRKRSEQVLRESEARFREMADGLPLIIWVHDAQGNLEFINETMCSYFNVTRERMRGGEWQLYIHPDDADAYIAEFERCNREQCFFHAEARVRDAQHRWRWIESWGQPRRSESGEFMGFVGTSADITERKQSEETLRIAGESFRQVVERSPLGVYAIDSDFRLAQISAGCHRVFEGIDPLIGRDLGEVLRIIWSEPFASEALDRFRHTFETGETYHSPNTTAPRGNVSIVESYDWQLERVTMPDGRFGVVCYFYETTARVQAEQDAWFFGELSELIRSADNAERLKAEVTKALGKYLHLKRCYFVEIEEANNLARVKVDYCDNLPSIVGEFRISDYPESIVSDARAGQIITVEDLATDTKSAEFYERVYKPLTVRAQVIVPLRRDDQLVGSQWVGSLCAIDSEPRAWTLREIGLLETVAERTWNAIEKLRLNASLRESELRYRTLLDATSAVTWSCPSTGLHVQPQASWMDYTGQSADEMLGDGWTRAIHPDDAERAASRWAAAVAEGQAFTNEHRIRRHDGQWRWMTVTAAPVRASTGEVVEWFGMCLDITERKRAEEALRNSDRRKNEFLATLAHELRNPLATIRSGLEIIKLTRDDKKLVAETRDMMERQFGHLVALVDDLLDISRISQGKLKLRRGIVSVAEVIQSSVENCRPLIEEAGHKLQLALPPDSIRVEGDSHRLLQAFANLISNAVKYTPRGGAIEIAAHHNDDRVEIRFKDSGIGIAKDQLHSVFDMFAQVDKGDSVGYKGLGIGLSLVKSLVESHGGSIAVDSAGKGLGSTFTVWLPTTQLQPEVREAKAIETEVPRVDTRRRVLVVDDNVGAAQLLAIVVKMLGHEVQTASNGREAIERGRDFKPELVIMDIGMPIMDGYEAARIMRDEAWGRSITLIALTGWGQDDDKQKTKDAGFDRHLVKPVEPDTLRKILAELAHSANDHTL